ncbi:SGNH/GDSL hydrolase family protein [Microvirga solisilvae]|uniref:SGNH/GDSL hydrolase family protein n=1 Tax=Microvirga solisilvae TaxID=2919498 RepID=UPI001FAEA144|nr:SGNH/GDSL hydrolase family protein [Microvirga solisilvae]
MACATKRKVFTINDTVPSLTRKIARHEPVRILAIGSSSTEGAGASSPDRAYPAQLEDELDDSWKDSVTVVNAGKGGETVIETIERLESSLKAQSFDLVIWQVGTNDAIKGVNEDAFRALLERGIAAVKASGSSLILLDQQYFPAIKDMGRYERFVQAVSTLGQERKVSVFSRYALMQDWNSRSVEELRSMLSADGFHMSDKGYDCLANHLADAIETLAQQPVASSGGPATQLATAR